jgi:hypothetical protein
MSVKIEDETGRQVTVRLERLDLSNSTQTELRSLIEGILATAHKWPADMRAALTNAISKIDPSLDRAFRQRAGNALQRMYENVGEETVVSALGAPSDLGALARALAETIAADPATRELDPYAAALARGAEHREQLLQQAGGALSAERVGQILHISRQAVDKRRANRKLLAVKQAGDWRYPVFQFENDGPADALKTVIAALDDPSGWSSLDFLLTPDSVLEGHAPAEALRLGPEWQDRVVRLARTQSGDGFA